MERLDSLPSWAALPALFPVPAWRYPMRHALSPLVVLALGLYLAIAAPGDDKKPTKGQLPPGFKKLGLSAKQTETIYSIQAKYRKQISDLRKQISDLQDKQKEEVFKVLTKEQKEKLLGA